MCCSACTSDGLKGQPDCLRPWVDQYKGYPPVKYHEEPLGSNLWPWVKARAPWLPPGQKITDPHRSDPSNYTRAVNRALPCHMGRRRATPCRDGFFPHLTAGSWYPDTTRLGLPVQTAEKRPGVVDRGVCLGRQSYGSPIRRVWGTCISLTGTSLLQLPRQDLAPGALPVSPSETRTGLLKKTSENIP